MAVRRSRLPLILLLLAYPVSALAAKEGQRYSLASTAAGDDLNRVEVMLQVGGEAILQIDGKKKNLPVSVVANVAYEERLLAPTDSASKERSIRYYDDVRVAIKVEKGGQKPSLRSDRRLIAAELRDKAVRLHSPEGPLTRDELDLIELPGSSLLVGQLLPNEPVVIGDKWSHDASLMAALLGLDATSEVEVSSQLVEVAGGVARCELDGKLRGATNGIGTKIEVKAKYNFDLKQKRINWFALLVKEKRAIGHVGPGLDVVAKLIMKVTPLASSVHLAPEIIASLPESSDGMSFLEYQEPGGTFQLNYNRDWYLTSDEKKIAIMRLIDRGELVAQCNIAPLAAVQKPLTLAEYQSEIRRTLGKNFGQFLEVSEGNDEQGNRVLRVVANGTVADLPIDWVYYLLTSPQGEQASLSFTLESSLKERFGAADKQLVGMLRFAAPPVSSTKIPSLR